MADNETEKADTTADTSTVPFEQEAAAQPGPGPAADPQSQLAQMQDRLLRSQAELDNFRKRARRELDDERKYANMTLLRDLLPVVDNVTRATDAAEKASETGTLIEGVKMVAQQLQTVLERHHCKRIEALHQPFDPNLHEAIMQQPSEEHPANTVILVAQPGYQLHDRVVRPAQVIVSQGKPAE